MHERSSLVITELYASCGWYDARHSLGGQHCSLGANRAGMLPLFRHYSGRISESFATIQAESRNLSPLFMQNLSRYLSPVFRQNLRIFRHYLNKISICRHYLGRISESFATIHAEYRNLSPLFRQYLSPLFRQNFNIFRHYSGRISEFFATLQTGSWYLSPLFRQNLGIFRHYSGGISVSFATIQAESRNL